MVVIFFHILDLKKWFNIKLFYKGLTGNLEIKNNFVSFFPNIWRLRQVRDTKFGTDVTAFTVSELLRGNQQGGGGKISPNTPRLGLRQ